MADLFYSYDEKILFFISGYSDNSENVKDIISKLNNNYKYMVKLSGVNTIKTRYIQKSSRYKYMRIFYCNVDIPPKDAFIIGENENKWTMNQWLEN